MVAALCAPLYHTLFWQMSEITLATALMALLLVWRHSDNIAKLIAGKESRLGEKKAAAVKR